MNNNVINKVLTNYVIENANLKIENEELRQENERLSEKLNKNDKNKLEEED